MNRRGFITGLGALLATSSLVRPPAPKIEVTTSTTRWTSQYLEPGFPDPNFWEGIRECLYDGERILDGHIGRWMGFTFVENDEVRFARINPSDIYE